MEEQEKEEEGGRGGEEDGGSIYRTKKHQLTVREWKSYLVTGETKEPGRRIQTYINRGGNQTCRGNCGLLDENQDKGCKKRGSRKRERERVVAGGRKTSVNVERR